MAHDDWRVRIELPDEAGAEDFLGRLGLRQSEAEELADDLREHRLAVSQDGNTVFVYASTGMQAEQAGRIVESELQDAGVTPSRFVTERWLREDERWDDEPEQPDVEEDLIQGLTAEFLNLKLQRQERFDMALSDIGQFSLHPVCGYQHPVYFDLHTST